METKHMQTKSAVERMQWRAMGKFMFGAVMCLIAAVMCMPPVQPCSEREIPANSYTYANSGLWSATTNGEEMSPAQLLVKGTEHVHPALLPLPEKARLMPLLLDLNSVLRDNENNTEALEMRARLLYENGLYDVARRDIDRAITLLEARNEMSSDLYTLKGYIMLAMRHYEAAEFWFQKALHLHFNDVESLRALTDIYAKLGDSLRAFEYGNRVLQATRIQSRVNNNPTPVCVKNVDN